MVSSGRAGGGASPIREMARRVENGEDILSLVCGEAAFEPPAELVELAARAMAEGRNRYTSTEGLPSLREAIAEHHRASSGLSFDPGREVLVTDVLPLAEAPAFLADVAARRKHVLTAVFTTTDDRPT